MALRFSKVDEVFYLIECEKPEDSIGLQEISLKFQFTHPQHKFANSYKMGEWDGEVRLIRFLDYDREVALAPCGLLDEIIRFCFDAKIKIYFKEKNFGKPILKHLEHFDKYFEQVIQPSLPPNIEHRDYQIVAVKEALKRQKAVMLSPTASGKSFIIYCYVRWLLDHELNKEEKILMVVPNTSLVEQMANDFLSYGYKKPNNISKIYYGQTKDFNRQIIISTWQSIYKYPYDWFDQFSGLIIDETHGAKANKLTFVAENCVNARFRLGTTATLHDDPVKRYQSVTYLGQPFKTKSTMELVEEGYLAPFLVKNILLKWKTKEKFTFSSYDEEYNTIVTHPVRERTILNFIERLYLKQTPKEKGTFLVLGSRIETLKSLYEELEKKFGEDVHLIYGAIPTKKREIILSKIKKEGGILVANISILGTGVNIPNVTNVINANPFKSPDILALQTIGRAIRLHPNKKFANIYDFFDKIPVTKHKYNKTFDWLNTKCLKYKKEGYQFQTYQYEMRIEET